MQLLADPLLRYVHRQQSAYQTTSTAPYRLLFSAHPKPPQQGRRSNEKDTMSQVPNQPYSARPAFAPLQSSSSSQTSNFSSTSSIASQSLASTAPPISPSSSNLQEQHFFDSLNQQQPRQQSQPQRRPSFEYHPNRQGTGRSAGETTQYLDQMVLLAEAAKRAQIACVMRDIEGMEL